jgi:hypothetical protein
MLLAVFLVEADELLPFFHDLLINLVLFTNQVRDSVVHDFFSSSFG